MIAEPGELVNKSMAIVHDKNKPLNYNIFDSKEGPIVPSISDWFGFAWHVIQNGLNPGDIIFQCPETRAIDSKRKGLLATLFKYLKLEYWNIKKMSKSSRKVFIIKFKRKLEH